MKRNLSSCLSNQQLCNHHQVTVETRDNKHLKFQVLRERRCDGIYIYIFCFCSLTNWSFQLCFIQPWVGEMNLWRRFLTFTTQKVAWRQTVTKRLFSRMNPAHSGTCEERWRQTVGSCNRWADSCGQRSFHSASSGDKELPVPPASIVRCPASVHVLTHLHRRLEGLIIWNSALAPLTWRHFDGVSHPFLPSFLFACWHISSFSPEADKLCRRQFVLWMKSRSHSANASCHKQNNFNFALMHELDKFCGQPLTSDPAFLTPLTSCWAPLWTAKTLH